MSTKYLGQPFDIHGGGRDLIFPHHENEIAQSEGAFDKPLSRFWVHNGFLNINQQKMSKSLGNFFTIREILEHFDALALRHYFLSSHYRSPMDFSMEGLEEASKAVDRIYDTLDRLTRALPGLAQVTADAALMESFQHEMDDDFNTPRALALIFDEVRSLNRLLDEKKTQGLAPRAAALRTICDAIGLLHEVYLERKKERWLNKSSMTRAEIDALIAQRNSARQAKDWQEADRLRDELQRKGIAIEDTPGGTSWKVK
jgi:cysteinyl-tRNA synthetase